MKRKNNKLNNNTPNDILHNVINDESSDVDSSIPKRTKVKGNVFENRNVHKQKGKFSRLTKQPTTEELNRLRETENLFSSNFFRLQIEELLKEVTIKPKYVSFFNNWFNEFNTFIENLEESETFDINDKSWFAQSNIKLPIPLEPSKTKGYFKFLKTKSAILIGSYQMGCNLGPKLNIDIKIEMPKEMFHKNDYLNEKYHRKRALYMVYLALQLKDSQLVGNLNYKLINPCVMQPILTFTPNGKASKYIKINLHFGPETDTFKISRFSPHNNNVRESWRFHEPEKENNVFIATPFYNSTILMDFNINLNLNNLHNILKESENIKQAILLLKIWLKQRKIYSFSGFIITMFVAYLIHIKRINNAMSSYQVIRNVWTALAASNWDKNGISLCDHDSSLPSINDFHAYFSVVFIDFSGMNNICACLSRNVYYNVKHESQLAVSMLDNPHINSFQMLFMFSINFYHKYDHILRLDYSKNLEKALFEKIEQNVKLDYGCNKYLIFEEYVCDLLQKGLGNRIILLTPKCLNYDEYMWSIYDKTKNQNPIYKGYCLGLKINGDNAFNFIDKGPEANLPDADEFRNFWGSKSELRRFHDGSILEACLWESVNTNANKRLIIKKIIYYLLEFKLNIKNEILYIADQFEFVLHNKRIRPDNYSYGTGEETTLKINLSLDNLMKNLRSITDIPLEINSVQGISSVFSYADPIPPLPYMPPITKGFVFKGKYRIIPNDKIVNSDTNNIKTEFVCPIFTPTLKAILELTYSGKWPDDLNALKRIKAAFYIQIAEALEKQCNLTVYPRQNYIDVFKDGYVFRLEINVQKEIGLLKKLIDVNGVTKYRDTDESFKTELRLLHLPRLRIALNGLYHHHQCYGPAVCLLKRWIRAHMIDEFHFPDICIDMIMAYVFLKPEPYVVPIQPQVAFWRALNLFAETDWNTHIIILNFNNDLSNEEIIEIENNFSSTRESFPPLYFVTPFEENKHSLFSKYNPTFKILAIVQIFASETLKYINENLYNKLPMDLIPLFKPNLSGYDILIYLKKKSNPLRYAHILKSEEKSETKKINTYEKQENEFIPIVDFNPVENYLNDLRSSYGEYALFFHDTYGGDVIGVLWNPQSLQFREFKTSTLNGRKLNKKEDKIGIIADIDALLEGFYVLGEGLIENIENVSNTYL